MQSAIWYFVWYCAHVQANDRLIAQSKDFPPWLYDDVKCLMGMSNVLWGCKICLKAIRNASMTDQTVKAGTQRSDASVVVCSSVCLPLLKHPALCTFLHYPVLSCTILYYPPVLSCTILFYPVLSWTIPYYHVHQVLTAVLLCCWRSGLGVGRTLFSLCIQRRFQFSFSRHVHSPWKLWKIGNLISDICLKSFDKYLVDCHQRAHMYHWWCRTGSQVGPRVPIFHNNLQNFCFECAIIADEANMSSTKDGPLHLLHKFKLVRNGQKLPAGRCHSPLVIW